MDGRSPLRRRAAIVLPALVLSLTLVLLPSMGSRLIPTATLTSVAPVATVVHLLGDEVVPAPPGPSLELRTRLLGPADLGLVILLTTFGASIALVAAIHRSARVPVRRSLLLIPSSPGRAPPRLG